MPFSESLAQFNGDYLRLTMLTAKSCENNGTLGLNSFFLQLLHT